jgi:CheY-like chemotaxis protein
MDASPCAVGFIGDLDDPWIARVADAISAGRLVHRLNCAGPLPHWPFESPRLPRAVIIHRHSLGAADSDRLRDWRAAAGESTYDLILCVSPYVRYEELERWSGLVDLVISEAIAEEVLPGRLARRLDGRARRPPSPGSPAFRIEVAGVNGELCRVLVDACAQAGYTARAIDDQEIGGKTHPQPRDRRAPAGERVLTIWEVPVLEDGWAQRLEWRAHRYGPVIAVAGFADRAVVGRAREAGAVACLDLPYDVDDLIDAVDRVADRTPPDSWPIPAWVEAPHLLPPPRRNPPRHGDLVEPSTWPDRGPLPRIPSGGP